MVQPVTSNYLEYVANRIAEHSLNISAARKHLEAIRKRIELLPYETRRDKLAYSTLAQAVDEAIAALTTLDNQMLKTANQAMDTRKYINVVNNTFALLEEDERLRLR